MPTDLYSAALIAIIVVIAGIAGIRSGISSAILEAIAGILIGNFMGVTVEPWLDFLGTFGGLMLILLAGAEVDLALLMKSARKSFTLGFMAFIVPFVGEMLFLYTFTSWSFLAKMVTGLADAGQMQAVFGAFLLGLVSANSIRSHENILPKIRSITFSLLSPLFFIKAGLLVSLPAIMQNALLIFGLLGVKIITKTIGTYHYNKKWMPDAPIFSTILFSTGLTVGIVTAAFGRDFNFLDQSQFSVLTVTVILSAIIPAIIARRFIPGDGATE